LGSKLNQSTNMATPNTTTTMPTRTAFFATQAYTPDANLPPPISQKVIEDGCPICYIPFSLGEDSDHQAVTTGGSCRHAFGKNCLLEWLSTPGANSCAMCRAVVFEEDPDDEVDHWANMEDYIDSDTDSESDEDIQEDGDDEEYEDEEDEDNDGDRDETEEQIDMRSFLRSTISPEQQRARNEAAERHYDELLKGYLTTSCGRWRYGKHTQRRGSRGALLGVVILFGVVVAKRGRASTQVRVSEE
jgi:hypothetical protein